MGQDLIVSSLLHQTFELQEQRNKALDASGERFNIFSILSLEYNEPRLHSRFIAELLDPSGAHQQKELFLRQFLELLDIPELSQCSLSGTKVYTEEFIGPIDNEYLNGGYIDIVIKIPGQPVFLIENKINAGDQKHQLIRYKNYYRDSYLIYLTKDGRPPSQIATHNQITKEQLVDFKLDSRHRRLSYEADVLEWLEQCRGKISGNSRLRETVNQYISTVKKITDQTTDNFMANQIADIVLASNEHLASFFSIREMPVVKAVEHRLLAKFVTQMKEVADRLGLTYSADSIDEDFGTREHGTELEFFIPGSPLMLCLGFEKWKTDFSIGVFAGKDIFNQSQKEVISNHFGLKFGKHTHVDGWYYLMFFSDSKRGDEYLNIWFENNMAIWGAINDGTLAVKMEGYFREILADLPELISTTELVEK
ncbi:PD-(D/E)XK nuclease family protein [Flaviaesturariibacter aridisoli]|uniref:PD-(D/E)XK nuclease family protein n=1 Tax=Flaviaesturariibacter aridisoli TaxID=2545761 RepID=A0A4R4DWB7_9BACT|nr:PD-(D/E)XK nuclease family protein [Flaviaesturariibacter aridisoli]TCZ68375.1 hypothetical protein E0486_13915 [Flaviaesturariibacter aridisoli]